MVAVMTTSLITISPLPGTERAARGVGHGIPGLAGLRGYHRVWLPWPTAVQAYEDRTKDPSADNQGP
jgi:hypothetical protein